MGYISSNIRVNCLCFYYSDIAFKNYIYVKEKYLYYRENMTNNKIFGDLRSVDEARIIAVVFAQMAIESFCNNYAATCLGDDNFYDNFDKLDCIGKFQLICNFILKHKLDKSREPYTSLKTLKKLRNNYIHNKSTAHEVADITDDDTEVEIPLEVHYDLELKDYREALTEAKLAVKALVEMINFFEIHDPDAQAHFYFFGAADPEKANELKSLGLNYEFQD